MRGGEKKGETEEGGVLKTFTKNKRKRGIRKYLTAELRGAEGDGCHNKRSVQRDAQTWQFPCFIHCAFLMNWRIGPHGGKD